MRQTHGERAILRILPRRELHSDSRTRFSRHFARVVVKGETFAGVSTSHEPQSATVALTIHVTDVNEQPVLPPLVTVAVDENSVHGTPIGDAIVGADEDASDADGLA